MKNDCLNYEKLVEDALRTVVREALRKIASSGPPAGNHLYISFETRAKGVEMSETLREQFPDEMTIVLQHEYWDLKVEETGFRVTLNFDKIPHELVIPLSAVSGFADQNANFGLQFGPNAVGNKAHGSNPPPSSNHEQIDKPVTGKPKETSNPKIIALDSFRKI